MNNMQYNSIEAVKAHIIEAIHTDHDKESTKRYTEQLMKDSTSPLPALCLGTGVSADMNGIINGKSYMWNGLVYAVAHKILLDIPPFMREAKKKKIDKFIEMFSDDGEYLDTDNTLECVEYLKQLAYKEDDVTTVSDEQEDIIKERTIALIIHDLLNKKRIQETKDPAAILFNGMRKYSYCDQTNSPCRKQHMAAERKELLMAYGNDTNCHPDWTNYNKGSGFTLVEMSLLVHKLEQIVMTDIPHNAPVNILTYNYDDFTEVALKELGIQHNVIYDRKTQLQADRSKKVNIYHVHGYIPHDWDRNEMQGDLVFSENSYSHMSDEIYNWSNMIQANLLTQNQVIFIGFSGVDANFRRLMKESKKIRDKDVSEENKIHHKLFMSYKKFVDQFCSREFLEDDISGNIDLDYVNAAKEIILSLIKAKDRYYYDQLGIELLWHYEISEIPDIIHQITESLANSRLRRTPVP